MSCSFGDECRMPICAPNLVELELEVDGGMTPSLQRMPSLLLAFVKINNNDDHLSPDSDEDYRNQSILLHGLSEVQNLELLSPDTEMVFLHTESRCSCLHLDLMMMFLCLYCLVSFQKGLEILL
jgi:hypothetical protein